MILFGRLKGMNNMILGFSTPNMPSFQRRNNNIFFLFNNAQELNIKANEKKILFYFFSMRLN